LSLLAIAQNNSKKVFTGQQQTNMRGWLQHQQRASTAVSKSLLTQHVSAYAFGGSVRRAFQRQQVRAADRDHQAAADACSTSYDRNSGDWDVDQFMQLLKERRQAGEASGQLNSPWCPHAWPLQQ
jgi:hypothetical protein